MRVPAKHNIAKLRCGVSIAGLAVAASWVGAAQAQTAAPIGGPQCPINGREVHCTGAIPGGVEANSDVGPPIDTLIVDNLSTDIDVTLKVAPSGPIDPYVVYLRPVNGSDATLRIADPDNVVRVTSGEFLDPTFNRYATGAVMAEFSEGTGTIDSNIGIIVTRTDEPGVSNAYAVSGIFATGDPTRATITNRGAITVTELSSASITTAGLLSDVFGSRDLVIRNTGTIATTNATGIYATADNLRMSVINDGTIRTIGGSGIRLGYYDVPFIGVGAPDKAANPNVDYSVINTGLIEDATVGASGSYGITFVNSDTMRTLTNTATFTYYFGTQTGTIVNSGTIRTKFRAVNIEQTGNLTFTNSGRIENVLGTTGAVQGATLTQWGDSGLYHVTIRNDAGGTIALDTPGGNSGVIAFGGIVDFRNAGTIDVRGAAPRGVYIGDTLTGLTGRQDPAFRGSFIQDLLRTRLDLVEATNTGTIAVTGTNGRALEIERGFFVDADVARDSRTILANSGTIAATGNNAIGIRIASTDLNPVDRGLQFNGTSVLNLTASSIVRGGAGNGGGIVFIDGKANTVNNAGLITAVSGVAIRGSNSAETIDNSGRIEGSILLGGGDDTLIVRAGGFVTGATADTGALISGGAGNDRLTFAPNSIRGPIILDDDGDEFADVVTLLGPQDLFSISGGRTDTLVFGGDTDYSFSLLGPQVSNFGALVKEGPATLTLTGTTDLVTRYRVTGGTLQGQFGIPATPLDVAGGTFAGRGFVGATTVADGAILSPNGSDVGSLTLASLVLSNTSRLAFNLGAPGQVGGVANDLITVTGNLTLDGLLNVTARPAFGNGVYRLIDYGGTLIDNGLTTGTGPVATLTVQTSIPGQVNLVVGGFADTATQFWDGPGLAADGTVGGGSGIWNTTASNWTSGTGDVNSAWKSGFAILQAAPGTVTIAPEGVSATGLQFAVGGYRVQGGALTLTAPATLRVGDGSAVGAAYVATIASAIGGTGGIEKTDLGTLILTGTNTYAGGTRISSGALQVSSDAALGDGALTLNGGTLRTEADFTSNRAITVTALGTIENAATALTLSGPIDGDGALTKTGGGTLILSGANSYAGGTRISSGVLSVAADGALGTGRVTLNGGTFRASAEFASARGIAVTVLGGTIDMAAGLTLSGTLTGNGGLTKIGAGTLTLTGDATTFAGIGTVAAGTLDLRTTFGGTLSVGAEGMLAGTGNAGATSITEGGTLAPGSMGVGTITLASLSLSGGSRLAFRLGSPGVVGGTTNDLIRVTGNLILDGTLDVTALPGFGEGVYRLFDYGGALTDNGLALGSIPGAAQVQTILPGQVNLVVGSALQYWDGANTTANLRVDGGSGAWNTTTTNWTRVAGDVNEGWGRGFAVFQGAPGTVTIATEGVAATGLQLAVDGYRVEGGTLTLNAPATLRVGDGSAGSAGYTATIASSIAGSGGVFKTDLGTLLLTGTNGYTGGTTVNGGVLQVAGDTNLGAGTGGVTLNGGTLRLAGPLTSARGVTIAAAGGTLDTQANVVTLSGTLAGTGAFTKTGSGTLAYGGNGTGLTSTTRIAAGTLALTGMLGGPLAITTGATLTGTGRAGSLDLAGTVAPGNSPGTLTIIGDALFRAGSTYRVDLGGAGTTDLIRVGGAATIQGGSVAINQLDPRSAYTDGAVYRILDATGGRTGTFAGVTRNSLLFGFTLGYDPTGAFVTARQIATTYNQGQAAIGLEAFDRTADTDGLGVFAALLALDTDPLRAALDASSGEIYAGLLADTLGSGTARVDRLVARAITPAPEGWGLWGGLEGRAGRIDGDGNSARLNHSGYGVDLGIDYRGAGNAWAVGGGGGYTHASLDLDARSSRARSTGWQLGGFARYGTGGAGITASVAASYQHHDADVTRRIAFAGIDRSADGRARVRGTAATGELRYGVPVSGAWSLGPVASVHYAHASIERIRETGPVALALSGQGDDDRTRYGGGGFVNWQSGRGSIDLSAQYVGGDTTTSNVALVFAGAPATTFDSRSPRIRANAALLDLGARYDLNGEWWVAATARGTLAKDQRSLYANATIGWRF